MTKTSTTKNLNLSSNSMYQAKADQESDAELNLFYDQIKTKLDDLVKNPQEDTIRKILSYSKSK